jgi:hypothetical protein
MDGRKYYLIYSTTCLINGKIYVGKHITSDPLDSYLGSGRLLKRAIRKYGKPAFQKQILHFCDSEEDMNRKEAEIVTEEFCASDENYNLCEGGSGGFSYINRTGRRNGFEKTGSNPSIRASMLHGSIKGVAAQALRREADPEWAADVRQKISNSLKKKIARDGHHWEGRAHSDDTREKMRTVHADNLHQHGEKNSQFGSRWITHPEQGNRKIKKNDPIPEGWSAGRNCRKSQT